MENDLRSKIFLDEEVKVAENLTIVSKTDTYGTIVYMNDVFERISEYNKLELIGEPHNIVRHPDMPKVIFKLLWSNLKIGKNFHAIIKNVTRSGRYYWVITDFTINKDNQGKTISYTGRRKAIPKAVKKEIEILYKDLLDIEKIKGEKASENYLQGYLQEEIGKEFNEYIIDLFNRESKIDTNNKTKNKIAKGLNWFFFGDFA
ncbi:PAS domain-containing protein [Tenacibaculum sp. nBUS_03]|uniref:PAS domain-containing protein n=1 Tax=Tenacibaculum sp. nBUS_03 TaxID=3395320 RepID=UPI003EB9E268